MTNACLLGLLLSALILIGGCQKLLGDYTVLRGSGSVCAPRAVQCVGNVLQRCNDDGSAWANAAVCASEPLCDQAQGTCKQPRCVAGARQCVGKELQGCNANRDGWTPLAACSTPGHCNAAIGRCTEQPCEPGTTQCNGALLQTCNSDRSGWNDQEMCASAALCNAELGACTGKTCEPNQYNCAGSVLRRCNESLNGWDLVQSCDSEALCNALTGTCGSVGCTSPGAFRCQTGGVLERCADDLTGWSVVASCESAAHCDAVKGACNTTPCSPGDHQCNGATLEVCKPDSSGWTPLDTCATDGLCQDTLALGDSVCMPAVCTAFAFTCSGAQPQVCNAALTQFRDNGTPCLTAELCNPATGTCGVPVCAPGQTRCTGAQPEICNAGRTGYVANGAVCASAALCRPDTGTCGDVVCRSGQKRCDPENPTRLQLCNDTLDGWHECDTCATAELCIASLDAATCGASSCIEPTCALQDRWCGGTGNRTLFKCPSSRINSRADVVDVCETSGLCEATRANAGSTMCVEKTCDLEDRWCGGTGDRTLYKCPPSLINSQAIVLDVCETSGLCDQAHADPDAMTCPEPACATPGYSCGGAGSTLLQFCNAQRTALMTCDTCASAALCTDSLAPAACNSNACRACQAGEKNCDGSELRVCNAARTGFDATTCGSPTLCMNSLLPASQTSCDACVEGTFNCDGAQPQRCDDPGTGPAVWEDAGEPCVDAASCDPSTGTCDTLGMAGGSGL